MIQPKADIPKKIRVVSYYWACGNPSHHHKTRAIAATCIASTKRKSAMSSARAVVLHKKRALIITSMKAIIDGASLTEVGKLLGVSPGRAGQIIDKFKKLSTDRDHLTPARRDAIGYIESGIRHVRANPSFWKGRIQAMAKEWDIR